MKTSQHAINLDINRWSYYANNNDKFSMDFFKLGFLKRSTNNF